MKNPLLVPELREQISNNNKDYLREFFEETPPVLCAEFLSALSPEEVWEALRQVDDHVAAEIFSYLDADIQVDMAELLSRKDMARLLSDMPPDDRVDLLKKMPQERCDAILPAIAQAEREDIRRLSAYPEGTAGAVMTSDYASLLPELTATEAIDRLRREAPDKETVYYAYVVDSTRRLIGFVSLKDLIIARPGARVRDIMHSEVIHARATDDQEEAARLIEKYDLLALPVINGGDALVGIITHDDAFDIIIQEQTEDMEKLMAIGGEHQSGVYLQTPARVHLRNRAGWIVGLAVLGLVSGFIIEHFEGMLIQFAILATFMPMLAGTGGNTGSQSATLVIRALALREITTRDVLRVLFKELQVSVPLAVLLALLAWGRVYLFAAGMPPHVSILLVGIAISLALGFQVITATLIGAMLPLIAQRFSLDPAVVASPVLASIVDITGLLIFFMTAQMVLGV